MLRATTRHTRRSVDRSVRYPLSFRGHSMTGCPRKSLANTGTGWLSMRIGTTQGSRSGRLWLVATKNTTGLLFLTRHAHSPTPVHLASISRSEEHTSELQSPDHPVCRL